MVTVVEQEQQSVQSTSNAVPQLPDFFVRTWNRTENGETTQELVEISELNNVFTLSFDKVFGETLGGKTQTADFEPDGESSKGFLRLRGEHMTIGGFLKNTPSGEVKCLEARRLRPDIVPEEWDAEEDGGKGGDKVVDSEYGR